MKYWIEVNQGMGGIEGEVVETHLNGDNGGNSDNDGSLFNIL